MAKSLGSYISLNRNPVNQIRSFVSRTENREDEQRLIENAQLAPLSEEDVSFVIINAEQATRSLSVSSDPHRFPLELSPVQLQYLKDKPVAVASILRKLKDKGFTCKFDLEARKVDIRTLGGHSESEALQMIRDSIVEMDFPALQMANMEDTVDFLPNQDSDGMEALVVKVGSMVKLVGMADDMTQFGGSLRKSMEKLDVGAAAPLQQAPAEATKEEVIRMDGNSFDYLIKFKWIELTTQIKRFPNVSLDQERNKVKVKGPITGVDEAVKLVRTEMERVKMLEIKLGPQINVAVVAQVVQEIGQKYDCSITYQQNFGAVGAAPVHVPVPAYDQQMQSLSLSIAHLKEARVRVVVNALEKQKAHVIVNTTNSKLELSQGRGVSHCILQAAGPSIQTEVKQNHPKGVENGEVAESGPGNMGTCRTIYHGSLPAFPQDKASPDFKKQEDECLKWMVSLVFNCLIKASSSPKGYRTIALPALGTGHLEYPAQHVVQLMYKAIKLFKDDKRSGPIKDIIIVIYPDTKLEVKQMFLAYRQTYKLDTRHVAAIGEIHEENRKEEKKPCEFRVPIDQTLLQVVNGSLHDACDVSEAVLVLWCGDEIRNPGANQALICMDPDKPNWNKCSSYVAELPDNMCAADSTTLPLTTLIHCYCPDETEKSLTDAMVEGIKNAAQLGFNTATIPIAAGGHLSKLPGASTKMVINAIKQAKTSLFVFTVAIQDDGLFLNVATKVAKEFNKFQEPADIDKSPVAVDMWKKTYAHIAEESQSSLQRIMTLTNMESVLRITSDSDAKNKMAADEIEAKLNTKLTAQLQIQQTM